MKNLIDNVVNRPLSVEDIFLARFGSGAARYATRLVSDGKFVAVKHDYPGLNAEHNQGYVKGVFLVHQ